MDTYSKVYWILVISTFLFVSVMFGHSAAQYVQDGAKVEKIFKQREKAHSPKNVTGRY